MGLIDPWHPRRPEAPLAGSSLWAHRSARMVLFGVVAVMSTAPFTIDIAGPMWWTFLACLPGLVALLPPGETHEERSPWLRRLLFAGWLLLILPPAWGVVGPIVPLLTVVAMRSHLRARPGWARRRSTVDLALIAAWSANGGLMVMQRALSPQSLPSVPQEALLGALMLATALWIPARVFWLADFQLGPLPSVWTAEDGPLAGSERHVWPTRFVARVALRDRDLVLIVHRDPLPPWTEVRLPVPELVGLTARRRRESDHGGLAPNIVAGSTLYLEGDADLAACVAALDGPWVEVLHGWGATVTNSELTMVFEGDIPRREWLGAEASDGTSDGGVLQTLIERCEELAAAVRREAAARAGPSRDRTARRARVTATTESDG